MLTATCAIVYFRTQTWTGIYARPVTPLTPVYPRAATALSCRAHSLNLEF